MGWGPHSTLNANPQHPQPPGSNGMWSPRGLWQHHQVIGWHQKWDTDPPGNRECGGSSNLLITQKWERTAGWGLPGTPHSWDLWRDPSSHLPLELVVAQGGHSPREQGVVNGFGKFIHVFPFLFTLITEIPYTKHSSSSPPPALEQQEPPRGTQTWAAHSEIQHHREQLFFSSFFAFFFCFSFFPQNNTGNTSNV